MWLKLEGCVDRYGTPLGTAVIDTNTIVGVYEDVLTKGNKFVCNAITIEYSIGRAACFLPNATLVDVLKKLNIQMEEQCH